MNNAQDPVTAPQAAPTRRSRRPLAGAALVVGMLMLVLLPTDGRTSDASATAQADDVQQVTGLIDAGDFKRAESVIAAALAQPDVTAAQREALSFQHERMRRILLDFPHDEATVRARLREAIPGMSEQDFTGWDTSGLLEHQLIDGRKLYFSRAVSNLFRLDADAAARRVAPKPFYDSPLEVLHPHHRAVRAQALASGSSSALPRRVRITQSLTVASDAVPAGEALHAWIPFPRAIAGQQEAIQLVETVPSQHVLAPESTLQRTVSMQRDAVAGEPTVFSVTYELTLSARYFDIDPGKVVPPTMTAEIAAHSGERAPHIVFTDDILRFSREAVGDETNPYRIAQKLFAAVDQHIPWAGAREYSTITNISDYALAAGHGDCGQQTLLLMTLLRLNGIPARWQSGMIFSDGDYNNLHDWGQVYLAPYGWVPMDVTFGRLDSDEPGLEWFYLGGLDAYRIAFNDDHAREFVPLKRHFRSETVDSQRGEVEWDGGNLYFDQWDYDFQWQVLPLAETAESS